MSPGFPEGLDLSVNDILAFEIFPLLCGCSTYYVRSAFYYSSLSFLSEQLML